MTQINHPKFNQIQVPLLALTNSYEEFTRRNVEIIVLTIDNNFANIEWKNNILQIYGIRIPFSIIEDRNADIARKYGIVNPDRIYENSVRDVFIINPEGRISAILTYPVSCGRNVNEIIRIIDSLQLTRAYNVFTPSNWMLGDPVMLPTTHNFNEAMDRYFNGQNEGLYCLEWYSCFKDYYSLGNSNQNEQIQQINGLNRKY